MRLNTFSAFMWFSVFSYLRVYATEPEPSKDEKAYAQYEPTEYFRDLKYELMVHTDTTSSMMNYWGSIFIKMKCIQKTNKLFLDQKLIRINADTIKAWKCIDEKCDREITVHYGRNVSENDGYKIKLEKYMRQNFTYKIKLEFSSLIYTDQYGFVAEYYRPNYRLSHPNMNDNPEEWIKHLSDYEIEKLQATFGKTENTETSKGLPKIWAVDEFEETDLISTFSVALAVVDIRSLEPAIREIGPPGTDRSRVKIKMWAEEVILEEDHVNKVLTVAARSLKFFSDFFYTTYNVGKLDLIVLSDNTMTVEDNYGLIYLGENAVRNVFTESTNYQADRYLLVSEICQAMSRQWIGHLASISSWREEWFYNALHTYLQGHCVTNSLTNLIKEFRTATPNLQKVWNSWTKTANAEKEQQVLPKDITIFSLVKSWLFQRGHPLIKVVRNKVDNVITVHQIPFSFPDQNEWGGCWSVPFDILTKNRVNSELEKTRKWLTCSNSPLKIPITDTKEDDWIVISLKFHVPGRVQYDPHSWSLIQNMFNDAKTISNIDSWSLVHLIHDMFTLAEAAYIDYDFVFETMKYISHEKKYKCWHVVYQELKILHLRWSGTSLFKPLKEFVRTLVGPIFEEKIYRIDIFLESNHSKNILKRIIIQIACLFELSNCKEYSENLLKNLMENDDYQYTNPVPEFFQESFYCMAVRNSDETAWNFLLRKYEKDPSSTRILRALGCSRNAKILKNFLNWSIAVENIRRSPHLGLEVFEILSSSDEGYQLIITFFKISPLGLFNKKTKILIEYIKTLNTGVTIDNFLLAALKGTKKQKDLDLLLKFSKTLEDRKTEIVKLMMEAITIVKRNLSWRKTKENELLKYFSNAWKID